MDIMDRKDWESAKKQLKKAFDKGMVLLKQGAHEANIIKDKTVQAVGLEVELLQLKNRLSKDYQKLGKELASKLLRAVTLKVSPSAKQMAADISKLEQKVRKIENELKKFTVTRK